MLDGVERFTGMNCKINSVNLGTVRGVTVFGYGKQEKGFDFYRLFLGGRSILNDVLYDTDVAHPNFPNEVKRYLEEFQNREMMVMK